ncbi:hypothetical protein E3O19_13555 [Cryobacterium algoritolerans]|uniref:Uncharacterized protein n=1 Tax=Cryobacterium algoritolerans TaxID=1259184 RepID=A0A4R8WLH9_9MICO|nr:hypothetical protein [Cryobacterium algoritolerans]TFC12249.1 hypothetical protein E3O19_13555 [Cryobacterium algoritolerans]
MKRIFHPGGSVVTGSDLADAVMGYAESLSARSQVDVVDIPVLTDSGEPGRAQFLIGASSQLVSVTSESILRELVEAGTTADLRHRALVGMDAAMVGWTGDGLNSPQFDEFDY